MLINFDLLLANLLTLAGVGMAILFPTWQSVWRIVIGFIIIMIVPGYVTMLALFPKRQTMNGAERFALSLGFSIMVISFIGLLLNQTSYGIRFAPISYSLGGFVLLMSIIVWFRRQAFAKDALFTFIDRRHAKVLWLLPILLGFTGLSSLVLALKSSEGYTAFFMLGPGGQFDAYPRYLKPGESFQVSLGIDNQEKQPMRYKLTTKLLGEERTLDTFELNHGASLRQTITLEVPSLEGRVFIPLELYVDDQETAYRSLHLFIDVAETPQFIRLAAIEQKIAVLETLQSTIQTANFLQPKPLNQEYISYQIQPQDTLWTLAENFLGSGNRYPEIIQANEDLIANQGLKERQIIRIPNTP